MLRRSALSLCNHRLDLRRRHRRFAINACPTRMLIIEKKPWPSGPGEVWHATSTPRRFIEGPANVALRSSTSPARRCPRRMKHRTRQAAPAWLDATKRADGLPSVRRMRMERSPIPEPTHPGPWSALVDCCRSDRTGYQVGSTMGQTSNCDQFWAQPSSRRTKARRHRRQVAPGALAADDPERRTCL